MSDRYRQMYRAMTQYYLHGETMDAIARELGVSRSSVSRLLTQARDEGYVRITIADSVGPQTTLAEPLTRQFGVRVHLVPGRRSVPLNARLAQVAQHAATLFADSVTDHQRIGVTWGITIAQVTRHLPRRRLLDTIVVQMNGGAHPRSSGTPYIGEMLQTVGDAFDSEVVPFPVPAFFDHVETRRAMWRERSVRYVLDLQRRLDVAVFGVGSLSGSIPSHVYAADYLDAAERDALRADGVVGDICTVLLRADGSYADIAANQRATGLTPAELARIPRRICVAFDPLRAPAILAGLRAGVATDLVIDEQTAQAVVRLL